LEEGMDGMGLEEKGEAILTPGSIEEMISCCTERL
jgi:hypothetical protein